MKRIIYITLIAIYCAPSLFGQSLDLPKAKEFIGKAKKFYKNHEMYSIQMDYSLYPDANATTKIEGYEGVVFKKGTNYYSRIHHTETVYVNDTYVKVNHDEKALLYGKIENEVSKISGLHLEGLFQNFEKAVVTENEQEIMIKLVAPKISQSPYGQVIVHLHKKDYSIKKQIMFLAAKMPMRLDNGEEVISNPRLEIIFDDFETRNLDRYSEKLNLQEYIKKNGNETRVSSQLKEYQLIDITRQ